MKMTAFRYILGGLTAAAVLTIVPVMADQTPRSATAPAGIQTALAGDAGNLSDKFVGLARVMAGKYEWKPGPGVRSVAEVLNLIVMENKMLVGTLTGAASTGAPPAPITDPAQLQEALRTSYAALRQALAGMTAADLQTSVKFFGQDTTKQGAALMLIFDQHEHLGQSIAYARSNGIVPPWSK